MAGARRDRADQQRSQQHLRPAQPRRLERRGLRSGRPRALPNHAGSGLRRLSAVAVLLDRRIVATGLGGTDVDFRGQVAILRLLSDGSLDRSFGNGRGFVTTMVGENSVAKSLVLLDDGDAIAAGAGGPAGTSAFALVDYRVDGSLEEKFGSSGIALTPIGAVSGIGDVGLDGSRRLLAAGGTANGPAEGSFAAA